MIGRLAAAWLALAIAPDAWSYVFSRTQPVDGNIRKWDLVVLNTDVDTNVVNRSTRAVRYFLASDAYSSTNTAAELNALRASFDQWQLISGTVLRFEDAGLVAPVSDINTSDNTNVVFFAKTNRFVNAGRTDLHGLLGITFVSFFPEGSIAEADIVFNGVENDWFTDFSSTNTIHQFIEGTALHEIGHFIGLAHSPVGCATMFWVGDAGVYPQAGLSTDEIAAARALYPTEEQIASLAAIKGTVTKNASPVLGAVIVLENVSSGSTIAGTLSRTNGSYEVCAIPAGTYNLRVVPLDTTSSAHALLRGSGISTEFGSADPSFLPTTNILVTLLPGLTNTMDLTVQNGSPAFRIAYMREPTATSGFYSWSGYPIYLRPGQSNMMLGVASPTLPTSAATFSISGDGLTVGNPGYVSFEGLNFISVRVSVATNATAGLRTLTVRQGTNVAYANGFLEILPVNPDYDFDGLADTFQRQYFPRFTVPEADPTADPDGDGFVNSSEYRAGTNPTNSVSFLKIDSVTYTVTGSTVTWRSVAGRRYQLSYKPVLANAAWTSVGSPVTATGATTQQLDSGGVAANRFYRVEVLP